MDIQRLRNLTTGRLHTKMADIYQDIEYLTGEPGVMTHMLPDATKALLPYLRTKAPDARLWDGEYDPTHDGEIDIPPMNGEEQAEFWARFGGSSSAESNAAHKLQIAESAMRDAAAALNAVGSKEAILRAQVMLGVVKAARTWELDLRKIRSAGAG